MLNMQLVEKGSVRGSSFTEDESLAYSNITILGPRDSQSVSHGSLTEDLIMMDNRNFWDNWSEILFATLLFCLNIGNLWRFPTQVIRYGEGAFIYVYFVFSLIFGIPLLFFEFAIGQYTDKGFIYVFHIFPLLEGLSFAMVFFSNTVVHLYDMIVIFNFTYFFSFVRTDAPLSNRTDYGNMCFYKNRSNTLENLHFLNEVVMVSDEFNCTFNARNMCITFVIWLMIWAHTTSEYKTKFSHSMTIYIVIMSILTVTLVATMTVEGATNGILRLLSPSWRNFANLEVYYHAFGQSLITLGLGMGPLINFGSHTNFRTSIHIYAIIIVLSTLVASLIMTMIIFGAVGVYSAEQGFSDAVLSGEEYYVHVLLSKLFRNMTYGVKNLIVLLFYGAFLVTGFYASLQYIKLMVEFINSKWDINPEYHSEIILAFCACQFLISCGMISYHGIHLLYWSGTNIFTTFSVLTLVLSETTTFALLNGMRNFCDDIEFMVGYRPNWWFKIVWSSSIVLCSIVLVASAHEIFTSGIDWYGGFSILMYLLVVVSPITMKAIYTSVTAIREGQFARVLQAREVQTAFSEYLNWRENLSNNS